jgi:Domain of unknown function (DUF4395)
MSRIFSFPNPVNELAARVVAGLVVATAVIALVFQLPALSIVLAVGFALRVGWGPRFDPFGLLATKVIAPRLGEPRLTSGPPKRFAQAIGLAFSSVAAVLFFVVDAPTAGYAVLGALTAAATLESAFGFCLGCKAFALLMRIGVIPQEVCESCNNIWADRPQPAVSA